MRFQNIKEEKEEDLPDVMAEIIAKILRTEKEEIVMEIDETYRVQMNYARKHHLPRKVHVRLNKKSIHDEILHRTRDDPVEHSGKQIIVLKQVPRRVRELSRPYHFLTTKLIKYISFRC
uniref:L1 transposable element RRM domain-containing protein n=1 Tax=Micrurus corallinus TaxID=54390 RepID=A0A2D4FVT5_MICCO